MTVPRDLELILDDIARAMSQVNQNHLKIGRLLIEAQRAGLNKNIIENIRSSLKLRK
jgi:hypothetical protein